MINSNSSELKKLIIAGRTFRSRLMIGTGKFPSSLIMSEAIKVSDAEIITVALRRVDLDNPKDDILSHIDTTTNLLLPNTSGAIDATEAVRLAVIAKRATGENWIKLEVTPNPYHLLPDPIETVKAADELIKKGFNVMPYIQADPLLAKRLENMGCVTVMPLASPIGTNKGIRVDDEILLIIDQSSIPVVIDAGLGTPSDASYAIEIGADAVMVNTAIAIADNPVLMAKAFATAIEAGYMARVAGLAKKSDRAIASSPLTDFLKNID